MKRTTAILFFLVFLFVTISFINSCDAQLPVIEAKHPYYGIILKADTITIKQGFAHLDRICSGPLWKYHRYVIKNDTTYIQFCLLKKVYRIEGKKHVRVKEYEL